MELVTVTTFPDLPEAELAKERLTLEGVDAFVRNPGTAGTMPFINEGGIHVQVAAADIDRAKAILGITT